jgi:hypothetical protein
MIARPVVARVTDSAGNPVPDVRLGIAPGSGTVPESTIVTDAGGRATVRWSLGRTAGDQQLTIRASRLKPVVVTTAVKAGAAANVVLSGSPGTAPAGKRLAKPILVVVTDVYGNPVADQLVTLQVSSGSASPSRVMTDKAGAAAASWTLGSKPGVQRLTASVPKAGIKQTVEIEAIKRR